MESNGYSQFEQSYLINELTQGMELARQLKSQMGPEHSAETKEILVQQIVSSYDKALFILGCGAPAEQPHQGLHVPSPVMTSSPSSVMKSPKGNDHDGKEHSLKRKPASAWTKQVKVDPETGLDGPPDDGLSWRKYGQKAILGAKYPRSYYRCTFRHIQDCWATKQVQRSNHDPTVFDITYKGNHKCNVVRQSKSAPTSPAKEEINKEGLLTTEYQQDSAMVLSFQTAPPPNNVDMQNTDSFPSTALGCLNSGNLTFSPSTLNNNYHGTFSTSGSGSYSMSPCKMDTSANVQHNLEADIDNIILAATSSTNAPTVGPYFSPDTWSFNPSFPFNDPRFLPQFFSPKGRTTTFTSSK